MKEDEIVKNKDEQLTTHSCRSGVLGPPTRSGSCLSSGGKCLVVGVSLTGGMSLVGCLSLMTNNSVSAVHTV